MPMKKSIRVLVYALAVLWTLASLAACRRSTENVPTVPSETAAEEKKAGKLPAIPDKLHLEDGVPELVVYDVDGGAYRQMDIESYVQGVLAGEMRNDWPMEALKAQAVLARTFVLKFVNDKTSRYSGADISTDISEAQAYSEDKINERIVKAVEETRGEVLSADGELPYAWFHAHAGGVTELATAALEYDKDEPAYTQSVESSDSDKAPTAVKNWTARYGCDEVGKACAATGVKTGAVESIEIGEKGESGRAISFIINGSRVSAPALRLQLDGTKMKSTLLSDVKVEGDEVVFTGSGYGHGVGLSQWGAYGMAEQGEDYEDIVEHYYKGVEVVSLWE